MVYTYNLDFILKITNKNLYGKTVFSGEKIEVAKIIVEEN